MGDIDRDPELDRKETDTRSDLEESVEVRTDAGEAADGGGTTSPLDPASAEDGVGGTAGEVKNQDRTAQ